MSAEIEVELRLESTDQPWYVGGGILFHRFLLQCNILTISKDSREKKAPTAH